MLEAGDAEAGNGGADHAVADVDAKTWASCELYSVQQFVNLSMDERWLTTLRLFVGGEVLPVLFGHSSKASIMM